MSGLSLRISPWRFRRGMSIVLPAALGQRPHPGNASGSHRGDDPASPGSLRTLWVGGRSAAEGLLVLACTAVTFTLVILTGRAEAGFTRIAHLVNAEMLLPQAVLACGAVTAGVVMLTMAIRQSLRQARRQHSMLLSTGWPLTAIAASIRAQLLSSLAPGLVLALLRGVLAAVFLSSGDLLPLLLVTFSVPVVAVAITLIWAQSYTRALAR